MAACKVLWHPRSSPKPARGMGGGASPSARKSPGALSGPSDCFCAGAAIAARPAGCADSDATEWCPARDPSLGPDATAVTLAGPSVQAAFGWAR